MATNYYPGSVVQYGTLRVAKCAIGPHTRKNDLSCLQLLTSVSQWRTYRYFQSRSVPQDREGHRFSFWDEGAVAGKLRVQARLDGSLAGSFGTYVQNPESWLSLVRHSGTQSCTPQSFIYSFIFRTRRH